MKRAILVTAGTVAGLAAALTYTPRAASAGDLAATGTDAGGLGGLSA